MCKGMDKESQPGRSPSKEQEPSTVEDTQIKGNDSHNDEENLREFFEKIKKISSLRKNFLGDHAPLEPTVLLPDDKMGATVLNLMTDWSWMKRRVEKIHIIADGQTRRQLSFDFILPTNSGLEWEPDGDPLGLALPLTFLRKGPLVNLNIEDQNGRSLPALSREENAQLTYQALQFLAKKTELGKAAHALFNSTHGTYILSESQDENGSAEHFSWDSVIEEGIYSIIMSKGYDEEAVDYDRMERLQEGHRYDLFSTAAQLCALKRTDLLVPEKFNFPLWLAGLNLRKSNEKSTAVAPRVLDSDPNVQFLAATIFQEITKVNKEHDSEKLKQLEILCQFLALTSISFLFTVLIENDTVFPSGRPSRQLLKISSDVEAAQGSPISPWPKFSSLYKKHPRLFNFFPTAGRHTYIRYSKWSAASTHLEFEPPANTRVSEIVAAQGPCLAEIAGVEDPSAKGMQAITTNAGKKAPTGTREEIFNNCKEPCPNRFFKYRHGSYRRSQGKVHVTSGGSSMYPVDLLRFTTLPYFSASQPLLAALSALTVTVLSAWILYRQQSGKEVGDDAWFTFNSFIAVETIVLAIFGTLLITTGRNTAAQAIWQGPRKLMSSAAALSVLSPILCLLGILIKPDPHGVSFIDSFSTQPPEQFFTTWPSITLLTIWATEVAFFIWPVLIRPVLIFLAVCLMSPLFITWLPTLILNIGIGRSLIGILLSIFILYSLVLILSAYLMQYTGKVDANQVQEEKIIEEISSSEINYRPYQKVVAVTETGVGDFRYLTDDFVSYCGLSKSLAKYREDLIETVQEITGPFPRIVSTSSTQQTSREIRSFNSPTTKGKTLYVDEHLREKIYRKSNRRH